MHSEHPNNAYTPKCSPQSQAFGTQSVTLRTGRSGLLPPGRASPKTGGDGSPVLADMLAAQGWAGQSGGPYRQGLQAGIQSRQLSPGVLPPEVPHLVPNPSPPHCPPPREL